jgi:hypothetical protein
MNLDAAVDRMEAEFDEIPDEGFLTRDTLGVTFASGIHESDLLSFVERANRLAGEVC